MSETQPERPPDVERLHHNSSPTIPTKIPSRRTSAGDAQGMDPSNTGPGSYRRQLLEQGYLVIPNLLPPHLLLAAQATSKYLVSRTRTGTFWPYVRTVPKQYPPWPVLDLKKPDAELNIWGIQHLLHPELTGLRDVYAEIYFDEAIVSVVRELLADPNGTDDIPASNPKPGVSDGDLVMELFNLLCSPVNKQDFELAWHRDDIRPEVSVEEEEQQLREKAPGGRQLHAQYNIALFEDESLIVVPGSHRRTRTHEEQHAKKYETLPGQITVPLQPGDAVFYDSNILHRGVYKGIDVKEDRGRMTLHGSVGLKGFGEERARQVLQHSVGHWIEKDEAGFEKIADEGKKERARKMRDALVEMGKGRGEIGYSLEG